MSAVGLSVRDMAAMDKASHPPPRQRRGFAVMDPEKQRSLARKGGAAVPAHKRSFAKDRNLAAEAGRKGGASSRGGGRPATPKAS